MAKKTILDSGVNKKKRRNKSLVDKVSATIILQSYLKKLDR
jgi:putative Holliday junction resolvase